MDSLSAPQNSQEEKNTTVSEPAAPALLAAMSVRIFAYGGPQGRLRPLPWQPEAAVTQLLQTLVADGRGKVAQLGDAALIAHFESPIQALAAARSLQQKLLTFHREASTEQLVAAAIIHGWKSPLSKPCSVDSPTELVAPATVLAEPSPAQILATEAVYDMAKTMPGFEFNGIPVRGPGETGTAENFYELLWADASTYANLRRAIQDAGGLNMPGQSRYEIRSELGRGAMGVVYKAHDRLIGRTVALKTITVDRNARDHDSLVERLKQEAKAAGCLDHPNIITIFDVGQEGDRIYLSMQFVEGVTLSTLLNENKLPPVSKLLAYAGQICSAVGYAHKNGVIHRDLKPANLMLTPQGTIKVLDFGIAKLGDTGLTQAGMVIGTPTYMAPEQAVGKKIDHRSDIFALGAVFYELFTRERPFKGEITTIFYKLINEDPAPPSEINPMLPRGLDTIIRKALAKDPQQRFQTCEEMQMAFAAQEAQLASSGSLGTVVRPVATPKPRRAPVVSAPETIVQPRPVKARRSRARVWAYVVTVASILVAGTVLGLRLDRVQAAIWAFRHPNGAVAPNSGNNATPSTTVPSVQNAGPAQPGSADTATQPASVAANGSAGTGNAATNSQPSQPADATGRDPSLPLSGNASTADSAKPSAVQPALVQPAVTSPANDAKLSPAAGTTTKDSSTPPSTIEKGREPVDSANLKARRRERLLADVAPPANVGSVDGFKRSDVPDLVRRADAAAGHGDYATARYEYRLVLRLDKGNAAARAGLQRVLQAQKER